ncbi:MULTISPECIES: exodeoxyribonuclease VII small subunit [unclassified Campylobacter]|uniref:exodeoxyribonuclease VII small subunit n=1 Tax=unclassified Campylobacter TaxID=2593542 RepID=UPI0022E99D86|nr:MULTISPECIES: exodeoxyribonuclease VII small subunit [unclassified Campylobacter]MDA3054359.1 exodeoxyribonuclease VII small subunit [Campylobacter sp. VBCF_07 NA4]MDA3061051.1 exodeoxyribonuclease VII small subunit [Campylobacter sp. VBCF_02 NA5]MDA3070565.1 exodeoxyribonuclease VII small subunit [Campylobacter sp. VBCF_08 NA3]
MQDNFEEKMKKIGELIESLNDKEITLDRSVELYKSGICLLKEAKEILENAKLEITQINEGAQND